MCKISGFSKRSGRRGASAVEFALVLPVLLLCLFSVVELGRFFWIQHAVAAAAAEGARFAILPEPSDSEVTAYTRQQVTNAGISTSPAVTVTSRASRGNGETVSVTVSLTFHFLVLPNFIRYLFDPGQISSTSTMVLQ